MKREGKTFHPSFEANRSRPQDGEVDAVENLVQSASADAGTRYREPDNYPAPFPKWVTPGIGGQVECFSNGFKRYGICFTQQIFSHYSRHSSSSAQRLLLEPGPRSIQPAFGLDKKHGYNAARHRMRSMAGCMEEREMS